MEKVKYNCSVCDGEESKIFMLPNVNESDPLKLYGAASGIPGTQQLVSCINCGMIFESPRYAPEVILKGYMASQDGGHDSQYAMRVYSFLRALKVNAKYLPPPGSKVLDIGTAGGAFLDAAVQFGYDTYGMEPSADLVERGKLRGLQIEQGTIDSHTFQLGTFDMVCLWDVIEHLPNPKSSLISIRGLLKPDGVLLINFPDIGTFQAKLAGKRFWWILSVHLHHFTRTSLRDICTRTGFEILHFHKYWQTLEFGYLQRMAIHYKIPFANLITRITPDIIKKIPIPYYASQTTAVAKIKK